MNVCEYICFDELSSLCGFFQVLFSEMIKYSCTIPHPGPNKLVRKCLAPAQFSGALPKVCLTRARPGGSPGVTAVVHRRASSCRCYSCVDMSSAMTGTSQPPPRYAA